MELINNEIITYGDTVRINKKGYVGIKGKIRFLGVMEGKKGVYYGLELDKKNGKYDGSFLNKKYFECDPRKGLFVTMSEIDKIIKKSKTMPRVTINSTVYVKKYAATGTMKYIGIPYIAKNKSKSIYYGIELKQSNGKNNGCISKKRYFKCAPKYGIFVKKDQISTLKQIFPITPGGPSQSVSVPTPPSKPSTPRKRRNARNQKKKKLHNSNTNTLSKSIHIKTKKKIKKKVVSKTFSKSPPASQQLLAFANKIKTKANTQKKPAKFKRKAKKKSITTASCKKVRNYKPKSCKKVSKHAKHANDDNKICKKTRIKSATCTPLKKVHINMQNMSYMEEKDDVFYDDDEDDTNIPINDIDYEAAMKIVSETLSIRNYRLFLGYICPVKDAVSKLNNRQKRQILNDLHRQYHANNLQITQNILHLALFIVKSMHSFYSLREKKEIWDFIDFLLQNGCSPLIRMTIKQEESYEDKNVFRLMNEALKTYKQNEILIVKRLNWLWSLVDDDFKCENRLSRPALLTINSNFSKHWIVADGYAEMPAPKILKEYLDFGCDLIHFCSEDAIYYDFNQIQLSLPPHLIITTLRINADMTFYLDVIGKVVLYYKYYYVQQRYNDILQICKQLYGDCDAYENIITEIVLYSSTDILYDTDELTEIDVIAFTLHRMPSYSAEWNAFLYQYVLCQLSVGQKLKLKQLTKKWDNTSEWDYFVSTIKNKQEFLCFIDVFEYVVGYKTASKITDYYLKKNNETVIRQYMLSQYAFKYLEVYNLLFNYDVTKNESANFIFRKLIDLVTNTNINTNTNRQKLKGSKSNARKEINNLYVQFCRHQVTDWMFENNFLYIFTQLLPQNILLLKKQKKSAKRMYQFDFVQAILHCFKAKQLQTLIFLMENGLVVDVERALLKFYMDDVIKRIIYGMDEFDEMQEDFLKLILNWSWQYTKNKKNMQTWYVKWLTDAQLIEDYHCMQILEAYCNLSVDNMV